MILRDRSALAQRLLRHGEPLLLWCVGLHVTLLEIVEGSVSALLVAAIGCQVVAAASYVRRVPVRAATARVAVASTLLVVAFVASDAPGRLSLLVWFTIVPVGFAVAVGLRQAWPVVVGMLVPHALAVGDVFESVWMVPMWAVPTFAAGIVLGLVSDLLSEVAEAATRAHDHERRLRTSVDTAPIGILTVDLDGRTTLVNALITDFIQVDDPPTDLASFARHVHPADVGVLVEMHEAIRAGRGMRRGMRVVHPDLGVRDIRVITAPMVDDDGVLIGAALTLQDVHEDLDNRRKLEQFRSIADATSDIVVIASYRPHLDYLNAAGQKFFGRTTIPLADAPGCIAAHQRDMLSREIREAVDAGAAWNGELDVLDADGRAHPTSAVVVGLLGGVDAEGDLPDDARQVESFAVICRDIADRKALEHRLAFEAGHDLLTGLPNRQQLFRALSESLAAGEPVAVLFGDLDGFKLVNDSLGHAVGDHLLRSVANRLVDSARAVDLVGRLGGDEFVVVCREAADPEAATAIAQRFIDVVRQPMEIDGRAHEVSMSIGIAMGGPEVSASELVQQADLAMYAAKRLGRRRVAVFDREMRVRADERMQLEDDLRVAIGQGEIELHYQPIVQTVTGDVIGFETLARWLHPRRGLLQPKEFMPVVESAGFARSFGRLVVREATLTASRMRLVSPRATMSINLSRHQLLDPDLVSVVRDALSAAQLTPSALTIEITEEMVMDELAAARPRLDALRDLGVRFAIDDFGTGYSNLSMLKQFSADYVKIDRSLVHGESELVQLVLSLTRELGFAAIAEGVETPEQLDELRAFGCHLAQGYLFAKPMTTSDAMAYLIRATGSPAGIV